MATQADVRRIALSLPDTEEAKDRFAFSVLNKGKPKGFAWVWMERVDPKKPRVANPGVLAVRVANLGSCRRSGLARRRPRPLALPWNRKAAGDDPRAGMKARQESGRIGIRAA